MRAALGGAGPLQTPTAPSLKSWEPAKPPSPTAAGKGLVWRGFVWELISLGLLQAARLEAKLGEMQGYGGGGKEAGPHPEGISREE